MQLWRTALVLSALACAAVSGCASKPSVPAPRAAVVVEQRNPANGFEKTLAAMQSGQVAVFGGLMRHVDNGGSLNPRSVGPQVGGLVEDGKAGVDDACTQYVTIRYESDRRNTRVNVRCGAIYTPGQRVMVVFTPGQTDVRDAIRLVAAE